MQIVLRTNTGDYVHEEEIPNFNEPPNVLIWGLRIFTLDEPQGMTTPPYDYVEAFTYFIPSGGYAQGVN